MKLKNIRKFSIVILFIFLIAGVGYGQTVWTWTPPSGEGNDTYVHIAGATSNYDESVNGLYIYAGSSVIEIDFPGLVDSVGTEIDSAYLYLYCNWIDVTGGAWKAYLTPLTDSFDETTVTFNNKPDSIGNLTYNSDSLSSSLGATAWWKFDIKRAVQAYVDETISSYGWDLIMVETSESRQAKFEDHENTMASGNEPYIVVGYVEAEEELTGILSGVYRSIIQKEVEAGAIIPDVRSPK